jgi:hypothetical protein
MEKKRVAVLFYGLTRSLKNIYDNLKEKLFDELINQNYEYDTFIHTYILDNPYINEWSGERITNYDNTAYTVINPKDYILQKQNLVERKLHIPEYYSRLGNWAGCAKDVKMRCYLVRNMVLALHSKKKVVELFSKYKNDYDYVIITRPDQIFHTKLNTKCFSLLNDKNIIIPYEHSYHGKNDRFCIAKPNVAILYGMAFNSLKTYSKQKSIISEVYMEDFLKNLGLHIVFSPIKTQLIRCKN